LGTRRILTRGFMRKICQLEDNNEDQQQKEEEEEEEEEEEPVRKRRRRSYRSRGGRRSRGGSRAGSRRTKKPQRMITRTCAPVNTLPFIFDRVMKALPQEQVHYYDIYEIQNLIVATALADDYETTDSQERIFETVHNTVLTDKKYSKIDMQSAIARDAQVIASYNELMESEENKNLRSYRKEAHHEWTEEQVKKFFEAFKIYGYGPTSNRKIAEYIGGGIHPNHVAYFKFLQRQNARKLQKEKQKEKAAV